MDKTKEQLEAMTKDELVAFALDKQKDAGSWYNHWVQAVRKLDALKQSLDALTTLLGGMEKR